MSRQNRNQERDRKNEETKRDVANGNDHYSKLRGEEGRSERQKTEPDEKNGFDRYRLNDLYERSSL